MLGGRKRLPRQRMDFLFLFSSLERIVIEIDGKQHYATDNQASPELYSEMVSEDRKLRLIGYEIYRFGGAELQNDRGEGIVEEFITSLFQKHRIN
jgi:very-short-patch-repair endonuclease